MQPQLGRTVLLLSLLSTAGCRDSGHGSLPEAEAASPTRIVVRQVDHILIESNEAEHLFSLLADTLQLPVAWPMSEFGGFASGGVAVGNVNVEVLRSSAPNSGAASSRITGFALEPEPLMESLAELRERGIPYGRPAPFRFRGPVGSTTTLWTTVGLPSFSNDAAEIFFCVYEHDVGASRGRWLAQLRARNGGPLSVRSVREVVYGAVDASGTRRQWQALLNPVEASSTGVWSVGGGPAIRVVQASENGILGVVISVDSLHRARQFLVERGLLGTESPGEITLGGRALRGVSIRLVQEKGA